MRVPAGRAAQPQPACGP